MNFVKCRNYETYNTRESKKEHKVKTKADEGKTEEEQQVPVPLVTRSNILLHSVFSNVEVYINNQQINNSNGLYMHKSYNSITFKEAISEYKGVFQHNEVHD